MTKPLRTRHRLTYILAALSAGALIAAAVPQRARAEDSRAQAAPQAGAATDQCSRIPPGFGHPPVNLTVPILQVLQRSVEPVPATDGLIHLGYAALVLNTFAQPVQIVSVVPVDPLAGFSPTGRNLITDELGRDVAGNVKLYGTSPAATVPPDPEVPEEPVSGFSTSVPAGNSGLMFFDVTYTAPDQVPSLLAHAITASPDVGGLGTPALTDPVPTRRIFPRKLGWGVT